MPYHTIYTIYTYKYTQITYTNTHAHTTRSIIFLPSSFHFIFRPKAFILRFPSTAIIMSQTSIKASSSHDLLRHLCRISFCCCASGFLLISDRSPSEMIFLCLSSCRTVLASVNFLKLSRKKSSTFSAAQKEKSRHVNNRPITLSSSLYDHPRHTVRVHSGECMWYIGVSLNNINCKCKMSEDNHEECVWVAEILDEVIKYILVGSKGNQYKYPEGWDKIMKRSVRKRADRVIMRGVEVIYKKNSDEVKLKQTREEQMRVLEMCHSDPTSGHFEVKKIFNQVRERFYWKGMFKDAEEMVRSHSFYMHFSLV